MYLFCLHKKAIKMANMKRKKNLNKEKIIIVKSIYHQFTDDKDNLKRNQRLLFPLGFS